MERAWKLRARPTDLCGNPTYRALDALWLAARPDHRDGFRRAVKASEASLPLVRDRRLTATVVPNDRSIACQQPHHFEFV
ncbi:MAG TPA: hypothetical protein VFQ61_15340 [Polyangiaceae bacterium]|nr:hypothetical protein [Polyangiaceae bacterium]